MSWFLQASQQPSVTAKQSAIARQQQLTKPTGSLADLEHVAIQLASLQNTAHPELSKPWISIFAADHGVCAENISAYPQIVTRQMLQNFSSGGACINVIAREYAATLTVIDCGTVGEAYAYARVEQRQIRAGTANFAVEAAMTAAECLQALAIGRDSVEQAVAQGASIYIAGEMGIGNTCSASALACMVLDVPADQLTGTGTGMTATGLSHKTNVIAQAIKLHTAHVQQDAFKALCAVGGLEVAAMTGAYIRSAQLGLPILVDGFISTVAALLAVRINPEVRAWMLFGHQSAEFGHVRLLQILEAQPLLKLNLRLGEGSGAGAALGLIRLACRIHNEMATFAEAAVEADKVE